MVALDRLMVFTGNANPRLAEAVVSHLDIHLGRAKVGRFSDGEVMVDAFFANWAQALFSVIMDLTRCSSAAVIYAQSPF